ncbi:hypothetical protein T07_13395 [Trichinella nelsoni]|uniref:Uncharacterized protein n=1 Tax=Trichinella nelsoni TaxID=6336 RepID=A0A0V0RNG2_9BILA|nr:hypothetical protein T07_13395 [Trichinella nelsoni]
MLSRTDAEELETVLSEIEARINNRPLMIMSDCADNDLALTPADCTSNGNTSGNAGGAPLDALEERVSGESLSCTQAMMVMPAPLKILVICVVIFDHVKCQLFFTILVILLRYDLGFIVFFTHPFEFALNKQCEQSTWFCPLTFDCARKAIACEQLEPRLKKSKEIVQRKAPEKIKRFNSVDHKLLWGVGSFLTPLVIPGLKELTDDIITDDITSLLQYLWQWDPSHTVSIPWIQGLHGCAGLGEAPNPYVSCTLDYMSFNYAHILDNAIQGFLLSQRRLFLLECGRNRLENTLNRKAEYLYFEVPCCREHVYKICRNCYDKPITST